MADKLPYDEIRELYAEVHRAYPYRIPWALTLLLLMIGTLLISLLFGS